jgi:polar amino acid transport system substrate-binding protein
LKARLPIDPEIAGIGAAAGVRKKETALKEKLNAALKAVQQSGEYAAISNKYFPFDVSPSK